MGKGLEKLVLLNLLFDLALLHLTHFPSQPWHLLSVTSPFRDDVRKAKHTYQQSLLQGEKQHPLPPKMRLPVLNKIPATSKHPGLPLQVHPSPTWLLSPSMQKLILTKT